MGEPFSLLELSYSQELMIKINHKRGLPQWFPDSTDPLVVGIILSASITKYGNTAITLKLEQDPTEKALGIVPEYPTICFFLDRFSNSSILPPIKKWKGSSAVFRYVDSNTVEAIITSRSKIANTLRMRTILFNNSLSSNEKLCLLKILCLYKGKSIHIKDNTLSKYCHIKDISRVLEAIKTKGWINFYYIKSNILQISLNIKRIDIEAKQHSDVSGRAFPFSFAKLTGLMIERWEASAEVKIALLGIILESRGAPSYQIHISNLAKALSISRDTIYKAIEDAPIPTPISKSRKIVSLDFVQMKQTVDSVISKARKVHSV